MHPMDVQVGLSLNAYQRTVAMLDKLRCQRDCLHRNFYILAKKYFLFEKLPEDLMKVLDEIEGEGTGGLSAKP